MKEVSLCKNKVKSLFLLFSLSASSSFAAVINVPTDQSTIANAVNAAVSGDVIIIAPGTYEVHDQILIDKQLTISSQWHTTGDTQFINQTILDGVTRSNTLFETVDNLGVDVEISGLTVTRFNKPIKIYDSAVIKHMVFTNNKSDCISFEKTGFGYVGFSTIENCGDDGIDIDAREGSLIVESNIIRNNSDDGIEIRLFSQSQPDMHYAIYGNTISGNDEDGVQLIDHTLNDSGRVFDVYNNVFVGNAMVGFGSMAGGNTIEDFKGASILERVNFYNNTIINNAVGVTGGDNFIALNNIIANNTREGMKRLRGNSVVAHSVFYNNGINHSDVITGAGIILNVDPDYDPITYTLFSDSSSIDSGVSTFLWNNEQVLDLGIDMFVGTQPDLGGKEFGTVIESINTSPRVNAGVDQVTFDSTVSILLQGSVSDDGLPIPNSVTSLWHQESGPSTAEFTDVNNPLTAVFFPQQGKYQFNLIANDGELTASDSVEIRYANSANGTVIPIKSVGSTFFEAEDYAYLYGLAYEISDSETVGGIAVNMDSELGKNTFSEHTLLITEQETTFYVWIRGRGIDLNSNTALVSFREGEERVITVPSDNIYHWVKVPGSFVSSAGKWPLIVRAGQKGLIWDRMVFSTDPNFSPDINQVPQVNAGLDQTITLSSHAILEGVVSDDSQPVNGAMSTLWRQVSGPGVSTFDDDTQQNTQVSFSQIGTYVLELSGHDSLLQGVDLVTIVVTSNILDIQVSTSTGDIEETIPLGKIKLASSALDLGSNNGVSQLVGLQFQNITIPPGATIVRANLLFTAKNVDFAPAQLTFQAEAVDNSLAFTNARKGLSNRTTTIATVDWPNVPAWQTKGKIYQTPDIASIVQEVIDGPEWVSNNSLAIVVSGTGHRSAVSFDNSALQAPVLHIEFATDSNFIAPTQPKGLVATALSASEINLSWDAITDNIEIAGYTIYNCLDANCDTKVVIGTTTKGSTYTISELEEDTGYYFAVDAFDFSGNVSEVSLPVWGMTLEFVNVSDFVAPTQPERPTTRALSVSEIKLSWKAATDNVEVAGYTIYNCLDAKCNTKVVIDTTTTGITYNVLALEEDTGYYFAVDAFDFSGNISEVSLPAWGMTLEFGQTAL